MKKTKNYLLKAIWNNDLQVKQVADKIGVTRATIYFWDSGVMKPTPEHLAKLAKVLKIEPEKLIKKLASH